VLFRSQGITDLIMTPGLINLDFADVRSVMKDAGNALMGIGRARGDDRAIDAARLAMSSPLLEASIDGARGVLLLIAGGSDLGLLEANAAADLVGSSAHPEANIIFGAVIDDTLGDEVKVTVIAAGFDTDRRFEQRGAIVRSVPSAPARSGMDDPVPSVPAVAAPALHDEDEDEIFRAAPRVVIDLDDDLDDDLDVPSFLR
jgi:cell division protein FtsZ